MLGLQYELSVLSLDANEKRKRWRNAEALLRYEKHTEANRIKIEQEIASLREESEKADDLLNRTIIERADNELLELKTRYPKTDDGN